MKENEFFNLKKELTPSFTEIQNEDATKFVCILGEEEVGHISITATENNTYKIGGLFVAPAKRGSGISSRLVKFVNDFLERNKALGVLVNTIQGDAAKVYENNGWVKKDFKSQGAYGAYEYIYDARK